MEAKKKDLPKRVARRGDKATGRLSVKKKPPELT